jgi:2''-5'' RNA ligase
MGRHCSVSHRLVLLDSKTNAVRRAAGADNRARMISAALQPDALRLFLGLWPAPALCAALQAHAATWEWPATTRRTAAGRLHITLHFLGNVAASRLADLPVALQVDWSGCEVLLDQGTVWPGGIAVLEATRVPAELAQLQAVLGERLRACGLPVDERRYRPHVTLARKATGARPPPAFAPLRWAAGPGYALVRSLPGGRGYETLHAFA